jgi:xanthine dehydrogenase YagR molybdenum-binding subunit
VLHAVLVGAPVAAGRLRGVDAAAARVLPGVVAVLTAADLPSFPELPSPSAVRLMPFADDRIRYEGQPAAIVLAESVEAAEEGRAAVIVDCERQASHSLPVTRTQAPPMMSPMTSGRRSARPHAIASRTRKTTSNANRGVNPPMPEG